MKPRILDLFCGAGGASMGLYCAGFEVEGASREFSDSILKLADTKQEPFYVRMVKAIMFSLAIKFKVFFPVIVLDAVYMVNFLSFIKTSLKMLRHYKPMFVDITILTSHRIIGAIKWKLNFNISEFCKLPPPFPMPMPLARLIAFLGGYFTGTRGTSFSLWLPIPKKLPAFLPTVNTGMPSIEMVVNKPYLSSPCSISNLHNLIIAHNGVNING